MLDDRRRPFRSIAAQMTKRSTMLSIAAGLVSLIMASAAPAHAQVSQTDLQIVGRALGFLERPMVGETRVGIVFDQNDPASQEQAESVSRLLSSGLKVGNVEMKPVLVPLSQAARMDVDVFFLTSGLGERASAIASIAVSHRLLCVTTDLDQVKSGACQMGLESRPNIRILVNKKAASNAGIRFATAFRVMIQEY